MVIKGLQEMPKLLVLIVGDQWGCNKFSIGCYSRWSWSCKKWHNWVLLFVSIWLHKTFIAQIRWTIVGDHGVAKQLLWPQLGVIVTDQGVARNARIGSHYWPSSWGCKKCPNQCTLFFWLSLVIIWLFFLPNG